jgi:hypothetical protein
MPDHPRPMHHKVTKGTETHGGSGWEMDSYRKPAAKARSDALSGEITFKTDRLRNGLKRMVNG